MMINGTGVEVYLLHVWIRQISPMIWRRLLVRNDCTIADLHYTLQIAFGWSDVKCEKKAHKSRPKTTNDRLLAGIESRL